MLKIFDWHSRKEIVSQVEPKSIKQTTDFCLAFYVDCRKTFSTGPMRKERSMMKIMTFSSKVRSIFLLIILSNIDDKEVFNNLGQSRCSQIKIKIVSKQRSDIFLSCLTLISKLMRCWWNRLVEIKSKKITEIASSSLRYCFMFFSLRVRVASMWTNWFPLRSNFLLDVRIELIDLTEELTKMSRTEQKSKERRERAVFERRRTKSCCLDLKRNFEKISFDWTIHWMENDRCFFSVPSREMKIFIVTETRDYRLKFTISWRAQR